MPPCPNDPNNLIFCVEMFSQASLTRLPVASDPLLRAPCAPPQLAGRWRASPYGGRLTDVPFGKNKKEPMFEHMKRPLVSRIVSPGRPEALDPVELAHLRTLPTPKVAESSGKIRRGKSRPASDAAAVLAYWKSDQYAKGSSKDSSNKADPVPIE